MTSKIMVLYNLIGRRQHHDVIDAVMLLPAKKAEKTYVIALYSLNISAYIRYLQPKLMHM